ncbi:uncharacterized protein B0I36DRAFT_346099 [Microdochium trichocladiopsis]|uniref:Myb-like domain-containing protein n=1 Tax=Microdochium trichocladiopsis TaxID=1682393 RepID=A0A9P8YEY0_9PEZI|nr:uncharacterized protein B0I36DRAFT_346099 [Microdochium trichocladiopsis]KAH7038073.1 hypothetical protein B0I36DRAFT_346099 [Microdochium trichocladiopsis]
MEHPHMSSHHAPRHMTHAAHYAPQTHSPHAIVGPLYHSLATTQSHVTGTKRPRSDDLDLGVPGLSDLDHGDIDSIHSTSLGAAYTTQPPSSRPVHHHHRLPDQPPAKMMRHDDGGMGTSTGGGTGNGGAPSVVGQAGMPEPAPRPRGPKLKFTPEDDQLLIDLKENKNLTWKQIADFFPGRSSGTLQVRYCTKLKAKATQWNDEMDQKLRNAIRDWENEKWRFVSNKVGPGFTPHACQQRSRILSGEITEEVLEEDEQP